VLRDSGFDPRQPTAWLAEGLLPYLTGPAQDAMFARIDDLSAPGSRIAAEAFAVDNGLKETLDKQRVKVSGIREKRGDNAAFDPRDLSYDDEGRSDCADWFVAHGWSTQSVDSRGEAQRLSRPVPSFDQDAAAVFLAKFVITTKP
jgi:methyltransferase (TIGR00027 family)